MTAATGMRPDAGRVPTRLLLLGHVQDSGTGRAIVAIGHESKAPAFVVWAPPAMGPDLDRLIRNGLDEWVGEGVDAEPRHTAPDDPAFLERVAAYYARSFGFRASIWVREP